MSLGAGAGTGVRPHLLAPPRPHGAQTGPPRPGEALGAACRPLSHCRPGMTQGGLGVAGDLSQW